MSLSLAAEAVPLSTDADGVFRVSGTRVALDSVIKSYQDGSSADSIFEQYPSIPLADIHAVLSFYLKHRESVEAYLHNRQIKAEEVRLENEARFDPNGIRARLLARRR